MELVNDKLSPITGRQKYLRDAWKVHKHWLLVTAVNYYMLKPLKNLSRVVGQYAYLLVDADSWQVICN